MKQLSRTQTLELLIAFTFGISIFLWKPGMYVSSGMVLLYAIIRLSTDSVYRARLFSGWIGTASLILFILGILACWIYPGTLTDTLYYARKCMFLLLFAPLLLLFENPQNRRSGLFGLILGLWIAALLTAKAGGWQWEGSRIAGSWSVDVMGVMTGFVCVFMLPFIFQAQTLKHKIFWALCWFAAFVMLILTLARGPWLATGLLTLGFLLVYQRKVLLLLVVIGLIAVWPAKHFAPKMFNHMQTRIVSIADSQHNDSNKIRLTLWELGGAHLQHKYTHDPVTFWFGSGPAHHIKDLMPFFEDTKNFSEEKKEYLTQHAYPGNDLHNTYIDTTSKMGIIWTTLAFAFLISIACSLLRNRQAGDLHAIGGFLVFLNFLIVGVFYDLILSFAPLFMVYLMTLSAQMGKKSVTEVA
ncbi:O-antigen ligase family protein [Orrella sp. 11846]|uniref:O-antigen ligase family protein n=1 Tax=Orrella sp. 11846 TaxID=3409913 RepID=UPI003B5AAD0D